MHCDSLMKLIIEGCAESEIGSSIDYNISKILKDILCEWKTVES